MFIVNDKKKFISAIPFIEGTKDQPLPVSENGHMIQHDGVLAEFNLPPVDIKAKEEFWKNAQFVIEQAQERLPKDLKLQCCTNGTFEESELQDPEANVAGCTSDYNAWDDGGLNIPPDLGQTPKRCAGFHLHFSFPGCDDQGAMRLVRILDVHLALPMLFIDEDRERRLLYGKAGCFRLKDFGKVQGVEYRTLSNIVLKNREVFDLVWGNMVKAIEKFNEGEDYIPYRERIENAINSYDLDEAANLCEEFEVQRVLEEELNAA